MASVKLWITGMTCSHCRQKVERALKDVSGVYAAIVDLSCGEVEVDFDDDQVTPVQLIGAVEKAGYGAKLGG